MTTAPSETDPARPARRSNRLARAWNHLAAITWRNPIVLKELRGRMRGWRAAAVIVIQLVVLSCFASVLYFGMAESADSLGTGSIGHQIGQALFYSTFMLLLTIVIFLSPAFTAGAISSERERKTLEILVTTLLSPHALVLGKLISALAYILLLILLALPIQSLALMFGGVALSEMLVGTLMLLVTALIAGSAGLLVSSLMKSSIGSTVLTYGLILTLSLGLPIVASILISILGVAIGAQLDTPSLFWQAVLLYVGGFLLCTNPFATAVTTKMLQIEQDTLFFFTIPLTGTQGQTFNLPLVSPWVVYVVFYTLLSVALIVASVLILKRKRG